MIYKELDPFTGTSVLDRAGRKAEEQMAHYLRRFFAESPDVDVLNHLRIELQGEVAQIDHLLLLPYGLLIVESKSVSEKVEYREDGQWIRWYQGRPEGMRSPVTQAQMQAMLLRSLLSARVKQKGFFDELQLDVLVAISDSGVIEWPPSGPLLQVCKADQVPARILARLEEGRGQQPHPALLPPEYRRVVADFLSKMHRPLAPSGPVVPSASVPVRPSVPAPAPAQSAPVPALASAPAPAPTVPAATPKGHLPLQACKHCGAQASHLHIAYGQYGYYFVCHECGKNTALRFSCPACGGEGRIRKEGSRFFAECRRCDASTPYFANPETLPAPVAGRPVNRAGSPKP